MNLVYLFSFNPIVVLFGVESALKLRMFCLHAQVLIMATARVQFLLHIAKPGNSML